MKIYSTDDTGFSSVRVRLIFFFCPSLIIVRVTVSPTGAVTINGEPLVEDYVYVDAWFERPPVDLVVPKGEIFVMGDHRNASKDSREIGTISVDSVLGKVLLRFYPFTKEKFGPVK